MVGKIFNVCVSSTCIHRLSKQECPTLRSYTEHWTGAVAGPVFCIAYRQSVVCSVGGKEQEKGYDQLLQVARSSLNPPYVHTVLIRIRGRMEWCGCVGVVEVCAIEMGT